LIALSNFVEYQQNAVALAAQPLLHGGKGGLFLVVGADPAEPHAERDEIGANERVGLRPDPPSRPIIAAMPLRIGRRKG
jgi:hypothetical protein